MEVLIAVLCDAAVDYYGKLCLLGTFDTIWAQQFPAQHPHCAIALRFLFREADKGRHALQVSFVDPDGRNILPQGGPKINFDITEIPEQTFFLSRNFIINMQGLPLPEPNQYSFDIVMDGAIIARIPLQVVQRSDIPAQ